MGIAGGWQKHVWFKKEAVWGTPVTPDIWLPVDSYDVMAKPEFYQANTFVGRRQRLAPNHPMKTMVNGSLVCDMYGNHVTSSAALKSVAEHLISAAFSAPAGLDLDSLTIGQYDPNDQKQHSGCRIGTISITGSADQGSIKLNLGIEGKLETQTSAPSLSQTIPHYKSFMFRDASFELAGSPADLRSFELTLNNTLVVKHTNSQYPSVIAAMTRVVDFKFSLFKTAATYDALRRATDVTDITGELVLKGANDGTATDNDEIWTVLTAAIDRMNFAGAEDTASKDDLWEQSPSYMVLKPATTDNDIDLVWTTSET